MIVSLGIFLFSILAPISILGAEDCGNPFIPPHIPILPTRVINGEEAIPHSFPWQVSIKGHVDEHYCGGSILSPNWVLTAAHCAEIVFIGTYFGDMAVMGQHDRTDEHEEGKQKIDIAEKFIHPNYDTPDKANDIALLKLKTPVVMGPTISPACLPDQGDFGDDSTFPFGAECILSGWGKYGPGENIPSDMYGQPWRLRQATLPLLSDAECSEIYEEGADFSIQPTMQCAGGDGHTACNGDSGGPLVCLVEEKWYQVGIVSFGPHPCDAFIPGVYTRVAGYTDWIHEIIQQNGGW